MNRLLVYQVPVKLSEERLQQIEVAMTEAATELG
jgi:hypothetical protein